MRGRYVVGGLVTVAVAAGCSSSGSTPPSSPTHSPDSTGLPRVTESFTVLPCPKHPTATVELEGCAEHRILRLDRQINDLAKTLYGPDPAAPMNRVFAAAQRAWITYRQTQCESETSRYGGGSLAPVVFGNCEVRLDRQRLHELQALSEPGAS